MAKFMNAELAAIRDNLECGHCGCKFKGSDSQAWKVKYELISGTNRLGDNPCRACHGDGRREVPRHHRKLVVEVISRIERIEATLDTIVAHRV